MKSVILSLFVYSYRYPFDPLERDMETLLPCNVTS